MSTPITQADPQADTNSSISTTEPTPRRGTSARAVSIAALLVAVMVLGGFAMLAIVPVAIVVRGTLRNAQLHHLRPWAVTLAVAYLVPLVLWALLPDRAPSLTKDMHPAFAAGIVAAALAHLLAGFLGRRR